MLIKEQIERSQQELSGQQEHEDFLDIPLSRARENVQSPNLPMALETSMVSVPDEVD